MYVHCTYIVFLAVYVHCTYRVFLAVYVHCSCRVFLAVYVHCTYRVFLAVYVHCTCRVFLAVYVYCTLQRACLGRVCTLYIVQCVSGRIRHVHCKGCVFVCTNCTGCSSWPCLYIVYCAGCFWPCIYIAEGVSDRVCTITLCTVQGVFGRVRTL